MNDGLGEARFPLRMIPSTRGSQVPPSFASRTSWESTRCGRTVLALVTRGPVPLLSVVPRGTSQAHASITMLRRCTSVFVLLRSLQNHRDCAELMVMLHLDLVGRSCISARFVGRHSGNSVDVCVPWTRDHGLDTGEPRPAHPSVQCMDMARALRLPDACARTPCRLGLASTANCPSVPETHDTASSAAVTSVLSVACSIESTETGEPWGAEWASELGDNVLNFAETWSATLFPK